MTAYKSSEMEKGFDVKELKFFNNEDDDFVWIEHFTFNRGVLLILSIEGYNRNTNHRIAVF